MGKGTYFQDVIPSFNYKCSWLWHSCNWGADLCQIISTDVRGWSPSGSPNPQPKAPNWGSAHQGHFSEASGSQTGKTTKGLALEMEALLCAFQLCDFSAKYSPSLSVNFLI